jgi:hypothetical protein
MTMSNMLTYGELAVGDWFIAFPVDGDNAGHGGYRMPQYIFVKTEPKPTRFVGHQENALNLQHGSMSAMPDSMPVIRVECALAAILRSKLSGEPGVIERLGAVIRAR